MKSILLYNPYWRSFGGGEKYLLSLAQSLSSIPDVKVVLLSRDNSIEKSELERYFHLELGAVEFRHIECPAADLRGVTAGAEILITLSNFQYVRNAAQKHVEVLQIPYGPLTIGTMAPRLFRGEVKEFLKDFRRITLLRFARERAAKVLVYSDFVAGRLNRNFGIKCTVLPPPIQDFFQPGIPKKKIILSVGRFFAGLYNNKRYDVLTEAFRSADRARLEGWEYHIAGSAGKDETSRSFLHELQARNAGYPVFLHANESYEAMRRLFNEAAIFWHAAGYGVDETIHPENSEHFGMTTVEAMSARCIPIVVNRGGQREIITEGKNGFLWEAIADLQTKTYQVAERRDALSGIAEGARARYEDYNVSAFHGRCHMIFNKLLAS